MFAMKSRTDLVFRILLIASILFSAPLNSFSAQAAAIKATPTGTSIDTPVAQTTPISTTQPEGTNAVPSTTTTTVPDTATPPAVTETAVPSATPMPPVTSTPSPIDTIVSQPSLSLSTKPDFLEPNSTLTLSWEITDIALEDHKELSLQITLPDILSPSGKYDGTYDAASHILTIPVSVLTGQVDLATADKVSDITLYAALLQDTNILAEAKLQLSAAQVFTLDAQGGTVSALAGKVQVVFPKDVLTETTTVEIGSPSGDAIPVYSLSGSPFEINATGTQSKVDLHQFKDEIEIDVSYADLNIPEDRLDNLYLYWYNPATQEWEALPSTVDTNTQTVKGWTNHFSVFDVGINQWQSANMPTVDAFQVSNFTGAGTISLPIQVPTGPGGLQPSLALSYNSQVIDEATTETQASWVGMGWSLETDSIEVNTAGTSSTDDDSYFLNVGGVSTRLVHDSNGVWHAADENFWKYDFNSAANTWTVTDKMGNQYFFELATVLSYSGNCSPY